MVEGFVAYMKEKGWNIELREAQREYLPEIIIKRYGNVPKRWLEFIRSIKCMVSSDETAWFLCAEDFEVNVNSDEGFQWNEWEIIGLRSAEDDEKWEREIRKFWDVHLPIIMSVKGFYSYYAIDVRDGFIVYGAEPEFEECKTVAASFEDFMEKIVKNQLL